LRKKDRQQIAGMLRAVRAGQYSIAVGSAQPADAKDVVSPLTITGNQNLPR
jgi:hypothetical protein